MVWINLLVLFSNDDTMEFSHVKFVGSRGDEVSAKNRKISIFSRKKFTEFYLLHSEHEWFGGTKPSPCILAECSRSLCILVKPLPQNWHAKFFLSIWMLSMWYCKDCLYLKDLSHWWHKKWLLESGVTGFPLMLDVNLPPGFIEGQALFLWCLSKLLCLAKLNPQVSHTWGLIPIWTSVSWAFKW